MDALQSSLAKEFILLLFLGRNTKITSELLTSTNYSLCYCCLPEFYMMNKCLCYFKIRTEQMPSQETCSHPPKLHSLSQLTRKIVSVHKHCTALSTKERLNTPPSLTKMWFYCLHTLLWMLEHSFLRKRILKALQWHTCANTLRVCAVVKNTRKPRGNWGTSVNPS